MNNVIEIENLTKTYGKNRGVLDVSLQVTEGEIYGFLGQNGAGKSTTIRSMLGLIEFQKGKIKIFEKNVKNSQIEVLRNIGYMPSEAMFYPSMKVADIIRLAADARKLDCREEAEKICERLQVDTKKKIEELSLGNRKKVSIVCALQHKPKLYILDEPTSGLDPLIQKEFFQLIQERNKEGASCFLSSHVLSEVKQYCHRVAIIKEGKLICVDTMENLSKTNAKRVKLSGICKVPSLEGMAQIQEGEEEVTFMYNGNAKDLLDALHQLPVTDILIEEPALEEIFLHFYQKGEK